MRVSQITFPDGVEQPSRRRISVFRDQILENSEICDNCFQQIRAIGDVQTKTSDLFEHELNTYYERTEHGSQEYTPFQLPSDRYGACYCQECGSAANQSSGADILSVEEMTERLKNIYRYMRLRTEYDVNPEAMGQTLGALKRQRENQGRDAEIFAVATARAIQ